MPATARDALRVSLVSVVWTLLAGTGAIAIGVAGNSLALISFGAIGMIDAIGSIALTIHFRHVLQHESISVAHERTAHRLITIGLITIGAATVGESIHRLIASPTDTDPLPAGIALALASSVVLAGLMRVKVRIARSITSPALRADGWVSGVGAVLALVALAGTSLDAAGGPSWIDPTAALLVGSATVVVAIALG